MKKLLCKLFCENEKTFCELGKWDDHEKEL